MNNNKNNSNKAKLVLGIISLVFAVFILFRSVPFVLSLRSANIDYFRMLLILLFIVVGIISIVTSNNKHCDIFVTILYGLVVGSSICSKIYFKNEYAMFCYILGSVGFILILNNILGRIEKLIKAERIFIITCLSVALFLLLMFIFIK